MLSVLRVGVKKQALHISFFIQLTLTLTLTLFFAVCQSVTAKSEGVRVKKKKLFLFYFLTNCHLRAVEYHDNLVERGGLDGGLHRFRFGIAVHLFYRLLLQFLYP